MTTLPERCAVPRVRDASAPATRTYYCWLVLDGVLADIVVSGAAVSAWRRQGLAGDATGLQERVDAVVRAELQRRYAHRGEHWSVSVANSVSAVRMQPRDGQP